MARSDTHLFTSESVSEGHPDKLADRISDAVLDAVLAQDPHGRVACETLVTTGLCMIAGEITSTAQLDFTQIARAAIADVGYTAAGIGFDADSCAVINAVHAQSPDIAQGVDPGGAGDQGLMFGYASDETDVLMPMPIALSHQLVKRLAVARKNGELSYLRPDSKSQVTVQYEAGRPVRVDAVGISTQHNEDVSQEQIHSDLKRLICADVIPGGMVDGNTKYHINPTGRFVVGGPHGDTGLTGRKIIVDTYGGRGRHGGGAFSGKDPTKVDRSACYMARYIAKNLVAAGLARQCEVQVAYAIGVAEPVSVMVDSFGTGEIADDKLAKMVREVFELTPKGIMEALNLRRPIFQATSAYGHFGRTEDSFTWERTDKAASLKSLAAA